MDKKMPRDEIERRLKTMLEYADAIGLDDLLGVEVDGPFIVVTQYHEADEGADLREEEETTRFEVRLDIREVSLGG